MSKGTPARTGKNTDKRVSPPIVALNTPTAKPEVPNAFTAFVAQQQKATEVAEKGTEKIAAKTSTPDTGVAIQLAAKTAFVHTVSNGRKDYTPHTIGALIWQTADALQAVTPNTPITAAIVRVALPHVKPASVSAGLSHWRKYHGTLRVKGAAVVPPAVAIAAAVAAAETAGTPAVAVEPNPAASENAAVEPTGGMDNASAE